MGTVAAAAGRSRLDDPDAVAAAFDTLDEQRRELARAHGTALADRLVALCEDRLAGTTGHGERIAPRPTAYIVATAETLLDDARTPGWLLTTLTGGKMAATSTLLQQLVDARGADVRTIVLDDHGDAIGVGRKTNVPPGWLRETLWARDLADTAPGGRTAVRRCDLDHLVAFDDGGPTNTANLQPVGRTSHGHKTRKRWTVTRTRDGTTVSGVT